jgi:hypothetical protein
MHESDFEEQQEPKNAAQSWRFAQAHRATAMIEDRNLIAKKRSVEHAIEKWGNAGHAVIRPHAAAIQRAVRVPLLFF